jgi:hypothetical protein
VCHIAPAAAAAATHTLAIRLARNYGQRTGLLASNAARVDVMEPSLSVVLREWHDFYGLVGTASATLVGLMFIAVSIGTTIFNENHRAAVAAFITPTVTHFAAVLFACLVVSMPSHTWLSLGVLLGVGALAGAALSGAVVVQMIIRHRFSVDLEDRLFYAAAPLAGYVLGLVAVALLFTHQAAVSADLIAAAVLTLLFAAIRNAWDMMVWIVLRTPGSGPPDGGGRDKDSG